MSYAVRRTYRVEEDLILIWQYIATDNPAAADRLLDRIEQRWLQLARYPNSGQARDDLLPGLRHLVVGEYLSFYRVENDEVVILRVLHGRRKIVDDDLTN